MEYGSGILSASGLLSMTLFRRWAIVTDIHADRYHYVTDGKKSDTNLSFRSKVKNTLSFSDAWSGGAGVDVHYDSSIYKAFVFPDLALTWKGKKGLRIRLEALNLLDRREYAYVLLSPLLEESYRLKIRPLTVILGADWQF